MMTATLVIGALALVVAGLVKGVTGMGLPTAGIGLLSLVMSPAYAAAMIVVPSAVTNVWQFAYGARPMATARRFIGLSVGLVVGTLLGDRFLGGLASPAALPALGGVLALYGVLGLTRFALVVPPRLESWLSPLIGLLTGLVTGTTGVSVIPAAPYLQALGLGRDDLVQALGLTFTVSTFALAATLALPGGATQGLFADPALVGASVVTLLPALLGMELGRRARLRLSQTLFRKVFFGGLAALGAYMLVRPLL
ncbi:sulfite exporter TauE/SafE family protein [Xanthobacter agilis]|uniref:sulfite exporter TauE/SafE family protein n=1 Tax=Xanthobacter agilis TaxID=47492 RepID=UPI00372A6A1E